EHEMAPDVVAIHVLQPEMWMAGAQLGRVLDPAAVVGGVDRLRAVAEQCVLLARPETPTLAVGNPHPAGLGDIDARCPLAPFRRHPLLPYVGRQHVEVEMVVAGDEGGVDHGTLRNLTSRGMAAALLTGNEKGRPRRGALVASICCHSQRQVTFRVTSRPSRAPAAAPRIVPVARSARVSIARPASAPAAAPTISPVVPLDLRQW